MRRLVTTVAIGVLALLVATAPASAQAAYFADGFEDEAADSGAPDEWFIDSGSSNVTTVRASTGSQSASVGNSNAFTGGSIDHYFQQTRTQNVSVDLWADSGGIAHALSTASGTEVWSVAVRNSELQYRDAGNQWNTIATLPNQEQWVRVEIYDINTSADTYDVRWELVNAGGSGTMTDIPFADASGTGYDTITLRTSDHAGFFDRVRTGNVGELRIYNETAPNQLVTDEVNATFYGSDDTIVSKQTTDGVVDLDDLDPTEQYVVELTSEDYVTRRVTIDDLTADHEAFLLNSTISAVVVTWELTDYTGLFPPAETTLEVQRALEQSGTTRYRTIHADTFGAVDEVSATIEPGVRYRLIIDNPATNSRRILGPVTPEQARSYELVIRTGNLTVVGTRPVIAYTPEAGVLPAENDPDLEVAVRNRSKQIASWSVTVEYVTPVGTSTQLDSTSRSSNGGDYDPTVDLRGRGGGTVNVSVDYTLADGETGTDYRTYRIVNYTNSHALLPTLATIGGRLPANDVSLFQSFLAIASTIAGTGAVATAVPLSTEALGAIAVGILAVFSVIAWLPYSVVFAGAVTWLGFAGFRRAI